MENQVVKAVAAEGSGFLYSGKPLESRLHGMGCREVIEKAGVWTALDPENLPSADPTTRPEALAVLEVEGASRRVDANILTVLVMKHRTIAGLRQRYEATGMSRSEALAGAFREFPQEARADYLRREAARQGVRS